MLTDDLRNTLAHADAPGIWAALAAATSDGLLVVAPDGVIVAMNERFGQVWGLPQDVLRTRDDEQALAAAGELTADPEGFITRVREIYANPTQRTHDEVQLRDGRVLDRYGTPLHDAGGDYLGWAWHFRDVTAQKATEADLRRLAETLQASLLPPRPPTIPGLEVAARYRSAHEAVAVSGDFYDVFRLRTNDWGLVLGDVCGKGVHAARLTALARYTVRAAAGHHQDPPNVLAELNDTLLSDPDLGERFASAIYAVLQHDVCGAWLTLGVAGHPLPIVVRRAGYIDTRGQPGSLLGLFEEISVGEDRVGLGPGDAIVFCTDGVTEARNDKGEEFADDALAEVLLANTQVDAETLADAVLRGVTAFSDRPATDDIAVVVVRVPPESAMAPETRLETALGADAQSQLPGYPVGQPHWGVARRPAPPREARLKLAGEPASASAARRFVRGVLRSWRMSELIDADIELLTSEVVGNAVRHTDAPFTVIMRYDGEHVRVEVSDNAPELPRLLHVGPDATGGRGIRIVHDIAGAWGVEATEHGKRVWFQLPVPQ
ncbi:MAG: SpoIIE family protein phosphatase [Nitriliruptorales bacterium]|nr:SpoIIE family protein phosphatase [Nitriliruptorales bacterium]